jgi:hypothetical protein
VMGASFTMEGGEIFGNAARYGGGVYVFGSDFVMRGELSVVPMGETRPIRPGGELPSLTITAAQHTMTVPRLYAADIPMGPLRAVSRRAYRYRF